MLNSHNTGLALAQRMLPMQRLADARRILEIDCDRNGFLDAEERRQIRRAKRIAWATLAEVTEQLVETLDAISGDPDVEDGTDAEDEGYTAKGLRYAAAGPGCNLADPGEDNHDRELVDEREPEEGL